MRYGEFSTKARPRGRFAVATKNTRRRVVHLVTTANAVWYRNGGRQPAQFRRMQALMTCGRWLTSASLYIDAPTEFELCNYCLMAELGIETVPAAPVIIARLNAGELDRVERELGVPVSRAVRLARIQAGAA